MGSLKIEIADVVVEEAPAPSMRTPLKGARPTYDPALHTRKTVHRIPAIGREALRSDYPPPPKPKPPAPPMEKKPVAKRSARKVDERALTRARGDLERAEERLEEAEEAFDKARSDRHQARLEVKRAQVAVDELEES